MTDRTITYRLVALMVRLRYLDHLDEQHGPNPGRADEQRALLWAIEYLSQDFAEEVEEAETIAEGRIRRRKERNGGSTAR